MHRIRLAVLCNLLCAFCGVSADTYNVKIATDRHVNVVDPRFLSFTIDPKYMFSTSEKYTSKECICMASSLTPAYIRIAGPSTSSMTFRNATLSIEDDISVETEELSVEDKSINVSYKKWTGFVSWAKSTGFDLVFALNNAERMASGMWDPNTALHMMTVAERANLGDIFWQLGYECKNQSIEEYLNDLETLRVITETFPRGRAQQWRLVGGDVTGCLHADSKSDFKDYVTLSSDMMDAILFNGNSTTNELDKMPKQSRLKLLKFLSHSSTPLWLTESPQPLSDLERAADWLASLGFSARNGFAVHYRELLEEEMYQPTLSFYMALLFKNLVGERVLRVDMSPQSSVLFAHCTALRRRRARALTLYGANLDAEPARMAVKLNQREDGGDVMQFVLGLDASGNIVVNGRPMYHEGDLKPVVKRVRPYKTLLINLPPKSFGFWVLANTQIEACYDEDDKENDINNQSVQTEPISDEMVDSKNKMKRSIDTESGINDIVNIDDGATQLLDENVVIDLKNKKNNVLIDTIKSINKDLKNVHHLFSTSSNNSNRLKRHMHDKDDNKTKRRKHRRHGLKNRNVNDDEQPHSKIKGKLGNLLQMTRRNPTRNLRHDKSRLGSRLNKNRVNKRNSKNIKVKPKIKSENIVSKSTEKPKEHEEEAVRERRSVNEKELDIANEIDTSDQDNKKLWRMIHTINKQLKDLSIEREDASDKDVDTGEVEFSDEMEHIDEHKSGFIKSTIKNLINVISDLNKNLNRFWNAVTFLE